MTATPQPVGQRRGRLSTWLRDLRFSQWSKGVFLVVLAGTAAFGGLDRVDTSVTEVEPGTAYDDGALDVTVKRATVVPTLRAGDRELAGPETDFRYLAVVADVGNHGSHDVPLTDELDLRDVTGAERFAVYRLADGTRTARMGPGLSGEMAFVWRIPTDALQSGDAVTVRIWNKKFTELSVAYGKAWIDSQTDYGQVEVPVERRT